MAGPMPDIMPETAAQCLEALPQALLLVNGAGAVVHANPAAGALIEFDPAAVRGRQVHEIIPGYLPQKRLLHSSGLPDGQTGEAIMRTRSGRTIHVEVSQSMVGRGPKPLFCVVMHDITAHRRKLDNLAKGHEKMLAVANNMPILLEVFDEDNCMVFWNKEFERVTGYSLAQYGGDPKMMELIYPDPQYRRDVEVGIGGRGHDFRDRELELVCLDGTVRTIAWYNVSKQFPIPGWHSWAIGVDVTERKLEERLFQENTERFAMAFNHAALGMAVIHPQGRFMEVNPFFTQMSGYSEQQCTAMRIGEMTFPEDMEIIDKRVSQAISGELDHFWLEVRLIHRTGETVWVHVSASLVRSSDGAPLYFVAHFQDLSDQKRNEQLVREAGTALRTLAALRDREMTQMVGDIASGLQSLVLPYLQRLKLTPLDRQQSNLVDLAMTNLGEMSSQHLRQVSTLADRLTPTELEVAELVRQGKTSQEIADVLGVSRPAISFHRKNIRAKLGIGNKKVNLRSHLQTFE